MAITIERSGIRRSVAIEVAGGSDRAIATEDQAKAGENNSVILSPLGHTQATQVQNVWPARAYGIYPGMSNPAAAINTLMATVAAAGGGDVVLTAGTFVTEAPIDNQYTGVMVRGVREDKFHDGGTNLTTGTVIYPATNTFRALRLRSPYGASNARLTGGGFCGLKVKGSYGVEVDSYSAGVMDVYLEDCAGDATFPYAAVFKCGVTGTDLAEACDVQDMDVHLFMRQFGTGAPQSYNGVLLTGSSNANVNFCRQLRFIGQMYDGDFVTINSADNCVIEIRCVMVGTGKTLVAKGVTATHPVGAMTNNYDISCGGAAIVVQGTDTGGVTAAANGTFRIDTGNGTPFPTFGTGALDLSSVWTFEGHRLYEKHVQPVLSAGYSGLATARAQLSALDSMMSHNGSEAFCWGATNGTRTFGARINASNELEFLTRQSAGGYAFNRYARVASATVAGLPSAASIDGAIIYVSNESGGAVLAFSDGTNWRRVTDRAIVS